MGVSDLVEPKTWTGNVATYSNNRQPQKWTAGRIDIPELAAK